MKEVILKKKVTLDEVDGALNEVIKEFVTQMRLGGVDEKTVISFLKAQSMISVDALEKLFGKAEVDAYLSEKLIEKKSKMGKDKWAEIEKKAKEAFERK